MLPFKKSCCDPLKLKKCTKQLLSIRPSIRSKLETLNIKGNSICSSCNIKISTLKITEPILKTPVPSVDVNISQCDLINSTSTSGNECESDGESNNDESDRESDNEPAEYEKTELINSLNSKILPALKLSPITMPRMSSAKYAKQKLFELLV